MVTIKRKPDFKKNFYEHQVWAKGGVIGGVDEVGRGCLAGPVVAASVILSPGKVSRMLKDSKLLNAQELQQSYAWIIQNSWYACAVINHRIIDKVNIYQATLLAMRRSCLQLITIAPCKPELIVVDAMPLVLSSFDGDIIHFIYGESKSSSIAAASIIAKVTRDRIMQRMAETIPGYLFESHKGYSTQAHKRNIKNLGKSVLHRISFIDHLEDFKKEEKAQQSLLSFPNDEIPLL